MAGWDERRSKSPWAWSRTCLPITALLGAGPPPVAAAQREAQPDVNLYDLYTDAAAVRGTQPAITYARAPYAGTVLSWQELVTRSEELAELLADEGVTAQTRCVIEMVDHPDTLPLFLAVWARGGIAVVVDPMWGEAIRRSVLRHSGAEILVRIQDGFTAQPMTAPGAAALTHPPLPPKTAVLAYTSGSTGQPKGIPLQHDRVLPGMYAGAAAVTNYRGGAPLRFGSSMRLSGFGVLLLHYLWHHCMGTEVVVLPELSVATAHEYWCQLAEHRIDQAVLVPALYELVLRASSAPDVYPAPLFINSSGPLTKNTYTRFIEKFGCTILNCYGLTEASSACTLGDLDVPGRSSQAIGRPFLLKVQLRNSHGEVVWGVGEGELEMYGPILSDGYYDNPAANEELFRPGGWMRSGDVARRDASGKLWITGRLKDVVMKGGQSVYLTEVDDACMALEGVAEAVAVRLDLPGGMEDIGVLLRAAPGVSLDATAVRLQLESALGRQRAPRRVIVVAEPLPRIGQNKPDRRTARELWAARAGTGAGSR